MLSPSLPKSLPTSPGGLEAVEQVDPLDVVGERRVGHQGLVAVDVVDCKLERQLVHAHQLTLAGLENPACHARARRDTHEMERRAMTRRNCSNSKNGSCLEAKCTGHRNCHLFILPQDSCFIYII